MTASVLIRVLLERPLHRQVGPYRTSEVISTLRFRCGKQRPLRLRPGVRLQLS
jgi:hypothetical protein